MDVQVTWILSPLISNATVENCPNVFVFLCMQGFTEAVMLLTNLIDKRQLELSDVRQRESLLLGLSTLKKCVPMINTSLQTFVKYPQNPQAKVIVIITDNILCIDILTVIEIFRGA